MNVDGGNVNATEGKFSQSVQAANFYSPEGMYNAYLGGERGRGVTAGYSGGNYGGIGYNIQHTGTMGLYKAPLYDTASYIRFTAEALNFSELLPGLPVGHLPSADLLILNKRRCNFQRIRNGTDLFRNTRGQCCDCDQTCHDKDNISGYRSHRNTDSI